MSKFENFFKQFPMFSVEETCQKHTLERGKIGKIIFIAFPRTDIQHKKKLLLLPFFIFCLQPMKNKQIIISEK